VFHDRWSYTGQDAQYTMAICPDLGGHSDPDMWVNKLMELFLTIMARKAVFNLDLFYHPCEGTERKIMLIMTSFLNKTKEYGISACSGRVNPIK